MIIFQLKELIERTNSNIYQLSKQTGISRTALYKIYKNEPTTFSLEYINKIADALNVSENELFKVVNDKPCAMKILHLAYKKKQQGTFTYYLHVELKTDNKVVSGLLAFPIKETKIERKKLMELTYTMNVLAPANLVNELDPIFNSLINNIQSDITFNQVDFMDELKKIDSHIVKKISSNLISDFFQRLTQRGIYLTHTKDFKHIFKTNFLQLYTCDYVKTAIDNDFYDFNIENYHKLEHDNDQVEYY